MNDLILNLGRGGLQTLLLAAAGGIWYVTKHPSVAVMAYSMAQSYVEKRREKLTLMQAVQRGGVGTVAGGGMFFTPLG